MMKVKVRFFQLARSIGLWLVLAVLVLPGSLQAQGNEEGQAYHIQSSDSLWKLAEKYLGDGNQYPRIIEATTAKAATDPSFTPIGAPGLIHPGQKIWIPEPSAVPAGPVSESPSALQPTVVATSAASPGGHVAFSFWNNAPNRCTYETNLINVNACLEGAESCQATRRIFGLNNVSEPAISPDGQRLAVRGWGSIPDEIEPGKAHPYADCAETTAGRWIQTATLDATEVRDMTGYYEDSHPDWSPDGTRVLFDTGRVGDGITRIIFFYVDSGQEEELQIAGEQPSWAPDNDRFVYRGCDTTWNRCGLWLARAVPIKPWEAGANLIGPLLEEPEAAHPDWSPVSDEIVYQSPAGGSWDLYLIKADGTGQRRLTDAPTMEGLPAWSPDGQWIAYVAGDGQNWNLRLVSRDGTVDRHLFTYDGGIYQLPQAISPYGSRSWLDEQISWSR